MIVIGALVANNLLTRLPSRKTVNDLLEDARAKLRRLEPREAERAVAEGALLVDIRPADQRRAEGAIPGALTIPRNVLEWRVDPASGHQHPEIAGREHRLILICAEGYQSSLAAATLHELGFPETTDVIGGFEAWAAVWCPVAAAEAVEVSAEA
jgi:rhodanese-related sulfurtransferase